MPSGVTGHVRFLPHEMPGNLQAILSVLHELECDTALEVSSDASIDVLPRHLHIVVPRVIF